MNKELKEYIQAALDIIGDGFNVQIKNISCEICNYSDKNIATENEWADITSFFNHLNSGTGLTPSSQDLERDAKLVLNEMRPILMNEGDPIYYTKIIQIAEQMMLGTHKTETMIIALDENNNDITGTYKNVLKGLKKHIKKIISLSDFKYVYNRLLQHSDTMYQKRYLEDVKNGLVPCVLIKNAILASYLAGLLSTFLQPLLMFYVSGYNKY